MSASKRPSTSSLRRFITSRPYIPVAELRRRFGLDEPDDMVHLSRNGTSAWIGLPQREAVKIQDLWDRGELGVELSVEVRAPVIVGVYPMRMARYVMENGSNGVHGNGAHAAPPEAPSSDGAVEPASRRRGWFRRRGERRDGQHAPRPMRGAPSYGSSPADRPGRD